MSLYPTEEEITMFGEKIKYPGLKDGKFTNGSFSDPKQLASFIPAETLNLILDNLEEAIKLVGLEPNNTDIDQLAKVISKVENNPVLSERIENAINLSNNEIDYVTPDENGIVYSQTVDLQQVLADKLGQNKKNIKIIDWNILNTRHENQSIFSNNQLYDDAELIGKEDFVALVDDNINTEELYFAIAIQVADELTEDIKNLNITKLPINQSQTDILEIIKNKRDCINASQRYKATILYNTPVNLEYYNGQALQTTLLSDASLYSIVYNLFDTEIKTENEIKKIVSNYSYSHISIDLLNIMFSAPSVISPLSVYNSAIFNSSSILFYGNKIKINIKSLENTTPIYET